MKRHKDFFPALLTAGVIFAGTVCGSRNAQGQNSGNFIFLKDGWLLQSSAQVNAGDPAISSASFAPSRWHPATVPETVLSALVKDGT